MRGFTLHAATRSEVDRLIRSLVASRIFIDAAEVLGVHAREPWRIQVSPRGDVAVLSVWRDHLECLALDALWCRTRAVPEALGLLRDLAAARGYGDLVSPPIPIDDIAPYEVAGMHTAQVVASYQLLRSEAHLEATVPEGVSLRVAGVSDIPTILALDALSFTPFWRYDARHLERFSRTSRLVIAERFGAPVGYTLSSADRGDGVLGRLCVVTQERGLGIGTHLVTDVLRTMFACGCDRVVLSTQVENSVSQALYVKMGFRDTARRFAFLRYGPEAG